MTRRLRPFRDALLSTSGAAAGFVVMLFTVEVALPMAAGFVNEWWEDRKRRRNDGQADEIEDEPAGQADG